MSLFSGCPVKWFSTACILIYYLSVRPVIYIHPFHIGNNASCLPPKILQNHSFQFLLGITVVQIENEDKDYAKLWRVSKVRYGLCENGELLVLLSIIQF